MLYPNVCLFLTHWLSTYVNFPLKLRISLLLSTVLTWIYAFAQVTPLLRILPPFSELKNDKLFMLMEKGEMDLEKHLHLNRKMECEKIRDLWIQMLCAVNSIHKQGIIHTDLKPANFLFVDSSLKLIDFGIAKGLQVMGFDTIAYQLLLNFQLNLRQ